MNNLQQKKDFDVIIIGGGAAGLSAALWCDDLKLTALLVESNAELGGQLLWTHNPIKNHLGVEAKNGREMRDRFVRQIEKRKFTLKLSSEIREIDFKKKIVSLETGENFTTKALIIATGIRRRKLNVEGEEEFKNKGIIESGKRDRNSIKNKRAAIVGGGDAALENALILADAAAKVWLIHRGKNFSARAEFVEQVLKHPKIEILTESVVRKLSGSEKLEAIELENSQTKKTFKLLINALLIRIGIEPNTEIFHGKIDLDDEGFIKINSLCQTSVKDVFAIGDVANPVAPTISGATGMGATAAKAIYAVEERRTE
ncbi:MAG: NAD(P)/FAD-dependent oxidoreductase [Acidobacteriota bacterium]|nr:NAD(P)/FAD-dependent oxidoreductase [Acidobacteriota bacterium]